MGKSKPETRMNGINIEKKCNKCGEFKFLMEFYSQPMQYLGKKGTCIECDSKVRKRYYQENKEKTIRDTRTYKLKNEYNLSREEFEKLCENGCHSCGSTDRLCVDHDHSTNAVRGILCHKCNAALGLLNDDVNQVLKLVFYLEEKRYAKTT